MSRKKSHGKTKPKRKAVTSKKGTRSKTKTSGTRPGGSKKTRSTKNVVRKNSGKVHKSGKISLRKGVSQSKRDHVSTITKGTGQNKNQVTFWFPDKAPEKSKLAILKNWNAEPLQYYITKNRPVKRSGRWVYSQTNTPVPEGFGRTPKGFINPEAVYVKLVKRKPRGKELYFESTLSPPELKVTRRNAHAFSVGVLEKYYSDFVGAVKDKNNTRSKYARYKSDPDDYEGKPLKVVAVIYHFIY